MPTASAVSAGTYGSGFSASASDTLTSAITAGNKAIAVVTWWGGSGGTLSSVSGGSLTWSVDEVGTGTSYRIAIASADAPSGVASGTTITANFSVSSEARNIHVYQADQLGAKDSSVFLPHQTGTSFSMGLTVVGSNVFIFGAGWIDFNTGGGSWTAPAVEITPDQTNVDGGSYTFGYKSGVGSGAQSIAGTNAGNDFTGVAVAYAISGGGPPALPIIVMPPRRH